MVQGQTYDERRRAGRAQRPEVPRSSHASWSSPAGRADPIALLEENNRTRLPDLVPVRYGRMLASPFAFLRGSAVIMAHDLATTPRTGLTVQACGDAHLGNFGVFGTPERNLVFDVNGFDETLPGPWEWDVNRLSTSTILAAKNLRSGRPDAAAIARSAGTGRRPTDGLVPAAEALPHARPQDLAVSAAVILVVLIAARITRRIPGPLIAVIAVIGAIVVSRLADLDQHGVAVTGPVPSGLPQVALPALGLHDVTSLLGTAASLAVVVLAQGAATSRAYAARHNETTSSDSNLVGLGAANVAAAFTSAFVVNGGATQTQMVDSAGGRSQLAQLTARAVVVCVLLFATGPLAYLPIAALAAVVFLIGLRLIDLGALRRLAAARRDEFAIAVLAAVAVVVLGVTDGIVLAVIASVIDRLRHTYHPRNSVLVKSPAGHWHPVPVRRPAAVAGPGQRWHRRRRLHRRIRPPGGDRATAPAACPVCCHKHARPGSPPA